MISSWKKDRIIIIRRRTGTRKKINENSPSTQWNLRVTNGFRWTHAYIYIPLCTLKSVLEEQCRYANIDSGVTCAIENFNTVV